MRILVVSAIWPHSEHSMRAANIVIFEMLMALVKEEDISLGLLIVGESAAIEAGEKEKKSINALKVAGIDILEPIILGNSYEKRSRLQRLFLPKIADWYPASKCGGLISRCVKEWRAEVILIPWSEWLTHACSEIPVIKFAYYGNPDPKAAKTQLLMRYRSGEMKWTRKFLENLLVNRFERIHLQVMKRYELLGDVAKNDAEYYTKQGHKNSFYIQNIWMKSPVSCLQYEGHTRNSIKIIGSIGKLSGTANTLGLEYLGDQVLPALDIALKGLTYELHIIGAGSPQEYFVKALNHPSVVWRGFVENIDEEIRGCDVFLCVNNATEYKVGHTRYLHAWSLSAPVVAHHDASLSMPEIEDGVNALLGENATEIAQHIRKLVEDSVLRTRIKKAGFYTFNSKFTANKVAGTILHRLKEYKSAKNKIINKLNDD